MHPAFQECIRWLYLLPARLSKTVIHEHSEMQQVAARLSKDSGASVKLPSYDQVRREIQRLEREPDLVAVGEQAKSLPRPRYSPESFVLFIPSPALLTQVEEHTMELYVVTPDGIAVTQRVHVAVLTPKTRLSPHDPGRQPVTVQGWTKAPCQIAEMHVFQGSSH